MPLGADQTDFSLSQGHIRSWFALRKDKLAVSVENLEVNIWSDTDWAGDRVDQKSTSGAFLEVNGRPIAWSSKKQAVVAMSTMEAEFIGGATSVSECGWIRQLLQELLHI